jgi:hypothetical protein
MVRCIGLLGEGMVAHPFRTYSVESNSAGVRGFIKINTLRDSSGSVFAIFAPLWAQPLLDVFPDKLADFLGRRYVLLLAEFFKDGLFFRVDQQCQAGSAVFHGKLVSL